MPQTPNMPWRKPGFICVEMIVPVAVVRGPWTRSALSGCASMNASRASRAPGAKRTWLSSTSTHGVRDSENSASRTAVERTSV